MNKLLFLWTKNAFKLLFVICILKSTHGVVVFFTEITVFFVNAQSVRIIKPVSFIFFRPSVGIFWKRFPAIFSRNKHVIYSVLLSLLTALIFRIHLRQCTEADVENKKWSVHFTRFPLAFVLAWSLNNGHISSKSFIEVSLFKLRFL